VESVEPRYVSADRMAALLGVSRAKLYQLTASGEVPAIRVGKVLRWHPEAVFATLERAA
jgi:excisionase family DNA binding protein